MTLHPAFIAGFIDGEGSFGIAPQNGGQSFFCSFSLVQRADDVELLDEVRRTVGIGNLYRVGACRTSKPQFRWSVTTMADCARLIDFLDGAPLLAKKARDFSVWRRAVGVWRSKRSDRASRLVELKRELQAQRRRDIPSAWPVAITAEYFDHYLAGFVTAEGHFGATDKGWPRFAVRVRADDRRIVDRLAIDLGVGDVRLREEAGGPVVTWRIARREELEVVVRQFDRVGPRGRKGRTYGLWRDLVMLRRRPVPMTRAETTRERRTLAGRIRASLTYVEPDVTQPLNSVRDDVDASCVEALGLWAAAGGPVTATAYARFRANERPDLPTRNTIATHFGSWRNALRVAGLSTDRARSETVNLRSTTASEGSRLKKRAAQREAILDTIRACREDLGTWPGAMEFFAWRLGHAPDTPSQATLYRAFGGGYAEAVAIAASAPAASAA